MALIFAKKSYQLDHFVVVSRERPKMGMYPGLHSLAVIFPGRRIHAGIFGLYFKDAGSNAEDRNFSVPGNSD